MVMTGTLKVGIRFPLLLLPLPPEIISEAGISFFFIINHQWGWKFSFLHQKSSVRLEFFFLHQKSSVMLEFFFLHQKSSVRLEIFLFHQKSSVRLEMFCSTYYWILFGSFIQPPIFLWLIFWNWAKFSSSKKNNNISCFSRCFSLFRRCMALVRWFSKILLDKKCLLPITYYFWQRSSWTTNRMRVSSTCISLRLPMILINTTDEF